MISYISLLRYLQSRGVRTILPEHDTSSQVQANKPLGADFKNNQTTKQLNN